MTTIGVLHPGEMGSAVGAAARVAGHRVLWTSAGRSEATRARAHSDGLEDAGTLARLVPACAVILSVCPPAFSRDVAREVAALGFRGIYVDANAIAPATTREVGELIATGGARFVDGGIVGPPPRRPGVTRLYLSGSEAGEVAALFRGGWVEAIALEGPVGAASALKMAYAGWNKGSQALLLAIRALAIQEGVDEALLTEWSRSMPDLPKRSGDAVNANVRKAWRFVGEMEEIAATFGALGLPEEFHQAAGTVYRRLAAWKDTPVAPSIAEVAKALTRPEA